MIASVHSLEPAIAMGTCKVVSGVEVEGRGKTYACAGVHARADKVGVLDGWVTGLVAYQGVSFVLYSHEGARTESEHVEKVMRDAEDRSMGQVKLVLPYVPHQRAASTRRRSLTHT